MNIMTNVAAAVESLPAIALVAGTLWILAMIAVPIVKWIGGDGAERYGIIVGVLLQVITVLAVLAPAMPPFRLALIAFGIPVLGWLAELAGSRTGIPFGSYEYTPVLQPQIMRVPVLIPLAWLMMMPPAWAVGIAGTALLSAHASLSAGAARAVVAVISGLAFTSWDLYLDTQMVRWGFWRWHRPGGYFGIPWVNFAGWFAVAVAITFLFNPAALPLAPLVLVFAVTWLLEFIGQFFFWGLKGSAIVGFLAMGGCLVLGVLGLFSGS